MKRRDALGLLGAALGSAAGPLLARPAAAGVQWPQVTLDSRPMAAALSTRSTASAGCSR